MRNETGFPNAIPETGRISIIELMGADIVDVSDTHPERAEGTADGGRHLAASIPNEPSRVRRGERQRVRRATSSTSRPRFRNATQRRAYREGRTTNVQAAAEARLAAVVLAYGVVGPTPRPDMFGPNTLAAGGPGGDIVRQRVEYPDEPSASDWYITRYADVYVRWERLTRLDGSEYWNADGAEYDGERWTYPPEATDDDTLTVTPMPDTFVPMGRNVELERLADAFLQRA